MEGEQLFSSLPRPQLLFITLQRPAHSVLFFLAQSLGAEFSA